MAKAILICGKLCSGKTFYSQTLKRREHAAVLSCDDLTLALFPRLLGSEHETVTARAQTYLFRLADELLSAGSNVILEWGFWTRESRRQAEGFFRSRGFKTEWHYLYVSDEQWRKNIVKRNASNQDGSYYVDDKLKEKCAALFEPPTQEEINVWRECVWQE